MFTRPRLPDLPGSGSAESIPTDPLEKSFLRIAIFASAFYPSLGGVEELVRQLTHAHRLRGDDALVITERWPRSLPEREDYEGFPVYRYPMRVPDGGLRVHANYRLTHAQIRTRIQQVLHRHRIDLLHVQCVSSTTHYALAAKQALRLPLLVSLQGELTMDAGGLFQNSSFARDLMRRALGQADGITACSAQTLAEAEEFMDRPFGERAQVVYNGIRLADFQQAESHPHPRPYILALGRHVPQKGFDVLLRAYAHLVRTDGTDHDLILAGDGDARSELEQLCRKLQLGDRVHFPGRVDREGAVRLFSGCSFFVLPSRHEPMGIVNLEAMAAEKPVIASRVGGVPELVHDGQSGILVPREDVSVLADALRRLTRDPGLRQSMGAAGRKAAEQFDWSVIAYQYRELYSRLTSGHRTRPAVTVPA